MDTAQVDSTKATKSRGRVLIVEDEALIAMSLEDLISQFGYDVAGTASSVDTARNQIENDPPDVVLLDLFLRDHVSYDLAAILLEKQIPFVIMSGSLQEVPPRYSAMPRLSKPFPDQELEKALRTSVQFPPQCGCRP